MGILGRAKLMNVSKGKEMVTQDSRAKRSKTSA